MTILKSIYLSLIVLLSTGCNINKYQQLAYVDCDIFSITKNNFVQKGKFKFCLNLINNNFDLSEIKDKKIIVYSEFTNGGFVEDDVSYILLVGENKIDKYTFKGQYAKLDSIKEILKKEDVQTVLNMIPKESFIRDCFCTGSVDGIMVYLDDKLNIIGGTISNCFEPLEIWNPNLPKNKYLIEIEKLLKI